LARRAATALLYDERVADHPRDLTRWREISAARRAGKLVPVVIDEIELPATPEPTAAPDDTDCVVRTAGRISLKIV
jgi:hypothetical protein